LTVAVKRKGPPAQGLLELRRQQRSPSQISNF